MSCGSGAVPVEDTAPQGRAATACGDLVDDLPPQVADQAVREVSPADAPAAAWGDPAIVLRCGVDVPSGFTDTSTCTTVDGVDWYIPEAQLQAGGDLTMTSVNRDVSVEVELPEEYFPPATALADLAPAVSGATEATGECF